MGGKPSKKLVPNRPVPKPLVPVPPKRKPVAPKKQVKMVPPDGGWGWMVVFGACLSLVFFPAVTVAFGVLFSERLQDMGAGATQFSIIGNGLSTSWSFVALLAAPLSELFGQRKITILGGFLAFLAMVLSAYSTSLLSFGLSYSIIGGMAGCLSTFNGFTIIPMYFSRRKGLANGVVASASALGKIAMAPLVRLLLDSYGYEWACLIVAALSLHTCVSGMLYQPASWHQIPEKGSSDCEILDMTTTAGSSQGAPNASGTSNANARNEEDEDIIFVMPNPPTPAPSHRSGDDVVLFSRVHSRDEGSRSHMKRTRQISIDSTLSWTGSLEYMAPVDVKIFEEEEEEEEEEEQTSSKRSCCDDFIVVKVFRMLNYSLVKDPKFHLVAWPNALLLMGYLNSMYALPGYVRDLNYSHYQSAFAISVFSATEVFFRLAFALLSDYSWFPTEKAYVFGIVLSAICMTALTLLPYYEWILVCVAINGIALSLTSVLLIHLMIEHLGQENYPQVIGFCSILNGFMLLLGGFFVGLAHDYFNSYKIVFYILSVFIGAGAAIWITWGSYGVVNGRYKKVSGQNE